jgi:hypothetical protein
MRKPICSGISHGAVIALLLAVHQGTAAEAAAKPKSRQTAELVTFPGTSWSAVKVVRGRGSRQEEVSPKPIVEKPEVAEVVTFGDAGRPTVRVVRGETDRLPGAAAQPHPTHVMNNQLVTFADPRYLPVNIIRGSVSHAPGFELFGPASVADLDRIAFAVDGAESSHGADLRMWRLEPGGPQGPMQVTAAAATDVGGGDRFDIAQNRVLGRAYLALMYQRYGNWPDAVAAYNWGPGNVDTWIGGGRLAREFPLEVERYRERVLRDAAFVGRGSVLPSGDGR